MAKLFTTLYYFKCIINFDDNNYFYNRICVVLIFVNTFLTFDYI